MIKNGNINIYKHSKSINNLYIIGAFDIKGNKSKAPVKSINGNNCITIIRVSNSIDTQRIVTPNSWMNE